MSRKPINVSEINSVATTSNLSAFSKWVPLICAGAAVGVSVLALKEIKNLRKELIIMKKDSITGSTNTDINKQVERMDEQLRKITEYLVKQKEKKEHVPKKEVHIITNAVPEKEINIINEDDEEVEYVEVTDDEEEES